MFIKIYIPRYMIKYIQFVCLQTYMSPIRCCWHSFRVLKSNQRYTKVFMYTDACFGSTCIYIFAYASNHHSTKLLIRVCFYHLATVRLSHNTHLCLQKQIGSRSFKQTETLQDICSTNMLSTQPNSIFPKRAAKATAKAVAKATPFLALFYGWCWN